MFADQVDVFHLQVECQQEPGQQGQLTLTLQQQTVASDTEVRLRKCWKLQSAHMVQESKS